MNFEFWICGLVGIIMIAVPLFVLNRSTKPRDEFYYARASYLAVLGGIFVVCTITVFLVARELLKLSNH
jgi:uncharacterized membrane protein